VLDRDSNAAWLPVPMRAKAQPTSAEDSADESEDVDADDNSEALDDLPAEAFAEAKLHTLQ
jgi:hypothetical protein